ncbi:MAG TPA: pyridoxal phosphate-dependent aminotransferase [candidate division Zixibacteria bacterium]|nr:pyridoxal phosphate-dependent aminotransferase [candidate division Zixibacteria bacterium]
MSVKKILSDCALRVPSSGTLKMKSLSKEIEAKGKKVIHLEVGEPNFKTPQPIIEAAYKAMLDGKTGYTSSKGIDPLLSKIALIHSKETGVEINAKENVITTPGAKAALFNALVSIVNPGDNIIVISPYWPSYVGIMDFIGAETKTVPAHYGDFKFPFETIKQAIDKNTKILLINSPSNPTGAIYEIDALKFVKDISEDNEITIISDEIYKKIIFESTYHPYLSISQSLERTLIIDGLSKSHAMTGWRIGYAIGNKELITAMNKIQQNVSTCVNTPTQWAAITALDLEEPTRHMVGEYKNRRDRAYELVEKCEYLSCNKPEGAFYLFIKYESDIPSGELALNILEEKGVALTAGVEFGVKENYLRVSLASDQDQILEGIKRINDYLAENV